jgi:hypothetical protein
MVAFCPFIRCAARVPESRNGLFVFFLGQLTHMKRSFCGQLKLSLRVHLSMMSQFNSFSTLAEGDPTWDPRSVNILGSANPQSQALKYKAHELLSVSLIGFLESFRSSLPCHPLSWSSPLPLPRWQLSFIIRVGKISLLVWFVSLCRLVHCCLHHSIVRSHSLSLRWKPISNSKDQHPLYLLWMGSEILWYARATRTRTLYIYSEAGPMMYLRVFGRKMLVLNGLDVMSDLLEKNSNLYSSRPTSVRFQI